MNRIKVVQHAFYVVLIYTPSACVTINIYFKICE